MIEEKKVKDINALIEKYDTMKKQEKMDLSSDQDITIAIMNLISIEEHLVFSGGKTGKTHFYDMVEEVREMRKNLLKNIVKEPEGEEWCISKHLLAASMRLMEVGTKAQSMGKKKDAYNFFDQAYDLYALFWGIQMKVVNTETLQDAHIETEKADTIVSSPETVPLASETTPRTRPGFMGKLGQLVRKTVDCCIE